MAGILLCLTFFVSKLNNFCKSEIYVEILNICFLNKIASEAIEKDWRDSVFYDVHT